MSDGVTNQFVTDSLIARQLDVEGLKASEEEEFSSVTIELHAALITALAKMKADEFSEMNKTQLAKFVRDYLKKYDAAISKFDKKFYDWLRRFLKQEAQHNTTLFNTALGTATQGPGPLWTAFWAGLIGASGGTAKETWTTLKTSIRNRVKQFFKRAYVQRWSTTQVRRGFIGSVARNRKDGFLSKVKNLAKSTIATLVQAGQSLARLSVMKKFMDYVVGYRWVSILDEKTSRVCRSLSGRLFETGNGPIPPMHYNCRSHIEPIFKRSATFKRGVAGIVSIGETYYDWLKRQPSPYQDKVLGKRWGEIFRKKGLTADEFAAKTLNARYQPVTLDQLEKTDPRLFK